MTCSNNNKNKNNWKVKRGLEAPNFVLVGPIETKFGTQGYIASQRNILNIVGVLTYNV